MYASDESKTPGKKLLLAILIAMALAIPIFMVWALVYDRQSRSDEARASITEGWGGPQVMSGPVLVIPYKQTITETTETNGKPVTRTRTVDKELSLDPEAIEIASTVKPELRTRSIYEAVVYDASAEGSARFVFPADLSRYGVDPASLELSRSELRFGLSDPRGLGANPSVKLDGHLVRLQPGSSGGQGSGFFAFVDVSGLRAKSLVVEFNYQLRGNSSLALEPRGGDIHWKVSSSWKHPSFGGGFLPGTRDISADGFNADYRIGNLSLGRTLVSIADKGGTSLGNNGTVEAAAAAAIDAAMVEGDGLSRVAPSAGLSQLASISLIQPVDLYSQVDRAAKYGFLFIAFTFAALLMFDIIGGARVTSVEYLLMGAAIVLFFVLLLAFSEFIGFTAAYVVASVAIASLNTAYSAAVLGSWKRGLVIGGLLIGLYAVLYILLGLEDFSLLIGSILLFIGLAGVMYATRRIDWSGTAVQEEPAS